MQMYGDFEGRISLILIIVHEVWVGNIMTLVLLWLYSVENQRFLDILSSLGPQLWKQNKSSPSQFLPRSGT